MWVGYPLDLVQLHTHIHIQSLVDRCMDAVEFDYPTICPRLKLIPDQHASMQPLEKRKTPNLECMYGTS